MDNSVNSASGQVAAAGSAFESASDFAFALEPVAQAAATQATQTAGQKDAGAVDAQRSAEARGNEPRGDFAQNRFQRNKPQKDIGKAFDKESDRVRTQAERDFAAKLESDPFRVVAKRLVTDLMRSKGITEDQALQEIDNGFYAAIAEREGISPGMARMLYAQQQPSAQSSSRDQEAKQTPNQNQQQEQADYSVDQEANDIVDELLSIDLPDGFDLEAAIKDIEFTELLHEHPTKSAVRIYHLQQQTTAATQAAQKAPQELADKLRARAEVPQSSRSSSAAAPPDFRTMSREEFIKYQRDNKLT